MKFQNEQLGMIKVFYGLVDLQMHSVIQEQLCHDHYFQNSFQLVFHQWVSYQCWDRLGFWWRCKLTTKGKGELTFEAKFDWCVEHNASRLAMMLPFVLPCLYMFGIHVWKQRTVILKYRQCISALYIFQTYLPETCNMHP